MGKEHISDISALSAENLNDLNRRRRITYIASTAGFMITILIAFVLTVYILSVSSVFSAAYYSDDIEMKSIDIASIRTGKYLGIPWIVLIPALVLVPITFVISIMRAGEFGQNGKIKLNWFDKIFSDMHICTLTLYGNKAIDQAQYIVYTMNSRELYTLKKVLIRTARISRYYVIIKRG